MASISTKKTGHRRILFGSGRDRKCLYLGNVSEKQALSILGYVENLLTAKATQTACSDAATNAWVKSLQDPFHRKLAGCGLVPKRSSGRDTIAVLVAQFEASKSVKASTVAAIKQGTKSLMEYFGPDRLLSTVTPLEADKWRKDLAEQGLAMATQSKRTQIVKQLFGRGVRWGMVEKNPFEDVRAGSQTNARRQHFVSRADIQKAIDACPDAEWKLIIGLCRFAGLRCPSEILALRWADINFDTRRMIVTSEKTKQHEGKEQREVPIVPSLLPIIQEAKKQAPAGAVHAVSRYRQSNVNLRTQFGKILAKAGIPAWPRLFQNLRATCETELAADGHPLQSIAKWMGHSPAVAAKHYLQVCESDYDAASGIASTRPVKVYEHDAQRYTRSALHQAARPSVKKQNSPSKVKNGLKTGDDCSPSPKTKSPYNFLQGEGDGRNRARINPNSCGKY